MKHLTWIVLALLASTGLSGCVQQNDCETTNDETGQRVVCRTSKTFSYTRNTSMASEKKDYEWQNEASKAFVSAAFNANGGSATVTVKDADGKTVYSRSHSHSGQSADDSPTTEGRPGLWTISINIGALNGQVAINVRSA